jgi:ribosomal protein L37E
MNESICRYCGEQIKVNEAICSFCGYNSETKTMSPGFIKREKMAKSSIPKAGSLRLVVFVIGMVVVVSLIVFFPDKANKIGSSIISYISNIGEDLRQYRKGLKPGSNTRTGLANLGSDIKKSREFLDSFINEDFSYKPTEEKSDASVRVEGIVFDSTGKGSVIIHGQVLYEGDNFENARIIKINKNSIEVLVDGKNKVLEVNQGLP